jgi:predicted ATP-dependent serine protease
MSPEIRKDEILAMLRRTGGTGHKDMMGPNGAIHNRSFTQSMINGQSGVAAPSAPDAGELIVSCMADIKARPISWLWPRFIPRGKLTIIAGNPGLGKSQLTSSIAAVLTTGGSWPVDREQCELGDALFLTAEDDPADTVRPRLEAAGANLERVHIVKGVLHGYRGDGTPEQRIFCLAEDLRALESTLIRLGNVTVLVIDPVSAYLGEIDSHKNAEIRGLLAPLSELAARHKVAVIAISHLNKAGGPQALMRVTGSLAFVAAARAAYLVAADPDRTRRLFLPLKNNLGPDAEGLAFRIERSTVLSASGPIETSRVMWESEAVSITADEVMQATGAARESMTALDAATAWLKSVLADGPVAVSVIL